MAEKRFDDEISKLTPNFAVVLDNYIKAFIKKEKNIDINNDYVDAEESLINFFGSMDVLNTKIKGSISSLSSVLSGDTNTNINKSQEMYNQSKTEYNNVIMGIDATKKRLDDMKLKRYVYMFQSWVAFIALFYFIYVFSQHWKQIKGTSQQINSTDIIKQKIKDVKDKINALPNNPDIRKAFENARRNY